MIIPELVFFGVEEYKKFNSGQLKIGATFVVGINSCNTLVLTVNAVGSNFYECSDNRGGVHAVDWDLEEFSKKQRQKNQTKWGFYNITSYGK